MLINGGAGVALLAFMSQMEKDGVSTMLAMWLPWSLSCFVVGVFAAALATGAAYFAQQKYYFLDDQEEYARAEAVGDRWRRLCIGLVVLSIFYTSPEGVSRSWHFPRNSNFLRRVLP